MRVHGIMVFILFTQVDRFQVNAADKILLYSSIKPGALQRDDFCKRLWKIQFCFP